MARGSLVSELRTVADDPVAVLEYVEHQGWGDGLPVIPPTEARVQAMLDATPLPPTHVVAVVEPRRGEATVEKIAVNAVMAGCAPEYLPAVLAAVEAVCEPRFNLYALNTTTCCATPALMLNGPARQALGIECGYSCLGQNGRANATIGRALRLVMRNVGGAIPGAVTKSVFGQPGRVSLCFGEWEERSPWPPFHVRRGFAPEDSTVTAVCATGTQDIADIFAETGEELIWVLAHSLDWIGNNKVLVAPDKGDMLLLLCPDFAHKIARDGIDVPTMQRMLLEWTRTPIERWHRAHWPKLERLGYVDGSVVPLAARPEQFLIAVAGGESGHHALYFCTFGLTWSVTKRFTLDAASAGGEYCELPAPQLAPRQPPHYPENTVSRPARDAMSDVRGHAAIDSVLKENRVFSPPEEFSRRAHIGSRARYDELYRRSVDDPEGFWGEMAGRLRWHTPWQRVLEWEPPFAKWFVGGRLNVSENCLDRHLQGPRRNKAALVWEGEPGERRVFTYQALHREVCRFANVLRGLGVRPGDRVGIYLPMIPEAVITMLACARIGATHSVVFGGFSAEALRDRMNDAEATVDRKSVV